MNIVTVNKGVPFQKMNPNASDIVLVNSVIQIAAKGDIDYKEENIKQQAQTIYGTSMVMTN